MSPLNRRTRTAAALAAAAFIPMAAVTAAEAAPLRSADTTTYTSAKYLQDALGLPSTETNPVIHSVTYDRFQWILQQPGKFAVLIGDPATDTTFKSRAQDVEAAADAAGVKEIYWFNPNLSGNAVVAGVAAPNLDIRKPDGITSILPTYRTIYGHAWNNLVGKFLGNGVVVDDPNSGTITTALGASATIGANTATKNDAGASAGQSTEVGNPNGGALYDYASGTAPVDVDESYFLVYDKDRKNGSDASKIAAWVDLSDETTSAGTRAKVTTAFGANPGSALATSSEFAWWKDTNNSKQNAGATAFTGKDVPVLTDADAVDGWRVHQVTYPELVFLLKQDGSKETVLLFGGTWCPNTRPVIDAVNRNAQENDVTVFNFDTILDGSYVGGGNSSANPLQIRNTNSNNAQATNAALLEPRTPSFIYGDVVKQYLGNVKTEYIPTSNSTVTFFPHGDTTKPQERIARLQVPFLFGYKGAGDTKNGGVVRQWIIDLESKNADGVDLYREYMSSYQYTRPLPNQIGLSGLPLAAPVWTKINQQIATVTGDTDPTTLYADTGIDTDDADFLVAEDKANVTVSGSSVNVSSTNTVGANTVNIGPADLATAKSELGASAPATLADAKTAYLAAIAENPVDTVKVARLKIVVGAYGVAQSRKGTINQRWGNKNTPGSVLGGVSAVEQVQVFFRALPNRPGVNTPAPTATPAPQVTPTPQPTAAPTATPAPQDTATSAPQPTPVPTNAPLAGGTGTITKVKIGKLAGAVAKAPTSKKAGTYKVTLTAAKGGSVATGSVTIKLTSPKKKAITLKGSLSKGVVTVKVPKLAKGTWKVSISWTGNTAYLAASAKGASIKVKK